MLLSGVETLPKQFASALPLRIANLLGEDLFLATPEPPLHLQSDLLVLGDDPVKIEPAHASNSAVPHSSM